MKKHLTLAKPPCAAALQKIMAYDHGTVRPPGISAIPANPPKVMGGFDCS
ncbi:MAG: hypothetical protein ACYC75_02205 [Minisyncoccota bacterium]